MSFNHLEQFLAEWLECNGFFVRRNIKVGKRKKGGYECELDVVGYHPEKKQLVHYETSTDTSSWAKREVRYRKKFGAGQKYIRGLFHGMDLPEKIEQYAVFLYASNKRHKQVGGGVILTMDDLLKEIVGNLKDKFIGNEIVPEQFPLLRMIHIVSEYGHIFAMGK